MVSSRASIAIGFCIFLLICLFLALIFFIPSHTHSTKLSPIPNLPPNPTPKLPSNLSPEFRVNSDTIISLNFTGPNLTIVENITVYFSNPSNNVNIFYNAVYFAVYYNVSYNNPTKYEFLGSTYLPPIYVGANAGGRSRSLIHINASTVNNTIDVGRAADSRLGNFFVWLSASVSFNGTLFNPKGYLLNVFCYPLHSRVSSNATSNATNVLLDGLSCV